MRDPFQILAERQQSKLQAEAPTGNSQVESLGNLMKNPEGPSNGAIPSLQNGYSDLDISGENIPLNALGRQILVNRLKSRWGDNVLTDKIDARKLLQSFDQELGKKSDQAIDSMHDLMNSGKMTLEALRG